MADKLIEESGYLAVNEAVVTAIQRDCPFFIPSRLVDFEYFGGDEKKTANMRKMAKDYQKEIDFCLFLWLILDIQKSDYEMLTPCEKAFIYKAWENKAVSDSTMFRDAALNAIK
ncbi:hypothetical protein [Blautia producta]|uniref:hypothetical protein n=1 Tax=Blautia producta TaxID=33035 RepID=UPI001F4491DC|nr:hypothetical protein [Blautia producta]